MGHFLCLNGCKTSPVLVRGRDGGVVLTHCLGGRRQVAGEAAPGVAGRAKGQAAPWAGEGWRALGRSGARVSVPGLGAWWRKGAVSLRSVLGAEGGKQWDPWSVPGEGPVPPGVSVGGGCPGGVGWEARWRGERKRCPGGGYQSAGSVSSPMGPAGKCGDAAPAADGRGPGAAAAASRGWDRAAPGCRSLAPHGPSFPAARLVSWRRQRPDSPPRPGKMALRRPVSPADPRQPGPASAAPLPASARCPSAAMTSCSCASTCCTFPA